MRLRLWTLRIIIILVALGAVASGPPIIHESYSHDDQWAECVRALTGKRLLSAGEWNSAQHNLPCPATVEQLKAQLAGSGVLVPSKDWDLLIGKGFLPPLGGTPPEFWREVETTMGLGTWGKGPDRPLTDAELKELAAKALESVRPSLAVMTPVAPRDSDKAKSAVARIGLELRFDIRKLHANGPDSIIGILREDDSAPRGRLIYGEYRSGRPVFLWDSPLLCTRMLSLVYKDVDQDGIKEIVLIGERLAQHEVSELVIFKTNGIELSRQEGCAGAIEKGIACPIEGGVFEFLPDAHGEADRIKVTWNDRQGQPPDLYTLESTYKKQNHKKARAR